MIEVTKRSPFTGKLNTLKIDITEQEYQDYLAGKLPPIQYAFPHLSADDREFLISGCTAEDWDTYMKAPAEPPPSPNDEQDLQPF